MRLAVSVVVVISLYVGRDVLIPIALAILLSFALAPVVRLLRRARLGRVPSVVVAVVLALALIMSMAGWIAGQINSLVPDLPHYATAIAEKLARAKGAILDQIVTRLGGLRHRLEVAGLEPAAPVALPRNATAGPNARLAEVLIRQPDPTPLDVARSVLAPIVSPLATAGIVLVMAILFLLNQADLRDRMIRLLGMRDVHRTTMALDDAANRLSRYLLTQLGLNTAFGIIVGLGLLLIGVPNALLCGVFAALFRFVPYIGVFGSAALPVVLAASAESGWSMTIWAASLLAVTELVTGQLVEPVAFGRSTGLSPVAVVLSAIIWTWMWGPIGLILSTPLTLCLVVLGRHVRPLGFLDVLMGDRPALLPAEKFHQRILANDLGDLMEQADASLKDGTLADYYDNVMLKGLQLVALDVDRGVVADAQLARIRNAVARLTEDLEMHEDAASHPPAAPGAQPVAPDGAESARARGGAGERPVSILCAPGDGPLDDIVCLLLARRLITNGLPAHAIRLEAPPRAGVETLRVRSTGAACISTLQTPGSTAPLRYLVRRLRRLRPGEPILVALLQSNGADPGERFRLAVEADIVVTSLEDALRACLSTSSVDRPRDSLVNRAANIA